MITAMHEGKGIGLAGPQVGLMERIFVVHVEGLTRITDLPSFRLSIAAIIPVEILPYTTMSACRYI
jgi:peptide deformylase